MIGKLFEYLRDNVSTAGKKVFTNYAPNIDPVTETTLVPPYIVINKISTQRFYKQDGISNLVRYRVQISIYDDSYATLDSVIKDVVEKMEAWTDGNVQAAFNVNELDMYDERAGLHHCPLDYFIWYEEN